MNEIKHTCGKCTHWYKNPPDPNNLTLKMGECREGPPSLTLLPTSTGQVLADVRYVPLDQNYIACDRFKARLEITE